MKFLISIFCPLQMGVGIQAEGNDCPQGASYVLILLKGSRWNLGHIARTLGSRLGSASGVAEALGGDSYVQEHLLYGPCQARGGGKQGWLSGKSSIIQGKERRTETRKHCHI